MSNNKKPYIDVYKTIYPIDIVVANQYVNPKKLNDLYCFQNGEDITYLFDSSYIAVTTLVKNRKTKKPAVLILYLRDTDVVGVDKKFDKTMTCTHEAIHAALDIYDSIGAEVNYKDQEAFAYFVEYIASCIHTTLFKK